MAYPRMITYSCCLLQHVNASPTPFRLVPAGHHTLDALGILIYYSEMEPSLLLLSFSDVLSWYSTYYRLQSDRRLPLRMRVLV